MDVYNQNTKQINKYFEVKHIDLYNGPILKNTVWNVKLSQMLAPRVFPLLQYCQEILQSLKKILFQYSNTNESKYIQLCIYLVEYKYWYATHRSNSFLDKIESWYWTANTKTYWNSYSLSRQTENFIGRSTREWNNRKNWFNASWTTELWNSFSESIDQDIKKDYIKYVLDARHFNSSTDQVSESWLLQRLATQIAGTNTT